MPHSLYLHIPFCPKICPYCDFHKMKRHEGLVKAYLNRLADEAYSLYQTFPGPLTTIYFGGGTPSLLKDDELAQIIAVFQKTWGWPAQKETTLEADPLTFDAKRLQTFRAMGFSRLSIGLQSCQDKVLRFLGRGHTGEQGLEAVRMVLDAGFNASADLITGITDQDTKKDLHQLAQTQVPHISVYTLSIEAYTPFALRQIQLSDDKAADDYLLSNTILSQYDYDRYEVSSHAKKGYRSLHNQVYWQGKYFLNLGPSASGFVPKEGYIGQRQTNRAIKAWLKQEEPIILNVGPEDYVLDMLMTGLRTKHGLDLANLKNRTGIDVEHRYQALLSELYQHKLLYLQGKTLKASAQGLMQLNGILKRFFAQA